jgi:hypothetical protein
MNSEGRRGAEQVSHVGIPGWGVDRKRRDRPGVPREVAPRPLPGAHGQEACQQVSKVPVLKMAERKDLPPVFGTAQPPRGLSGVLRQAAYRIPDHSTRHWAMLMVADRVDVIESGLRRMVQGLFATRRRRTRASSTTQSRPSSPHVT